jgi:predicted lipoprotein with Yx(FWY)xxD motif
LKTLSILCAALLLAAGAAQAHVVVQPGEAPPGAHQQLRFIIGHGCSGQPTTGLQIELPAGVKLEGVEPKPGWTVESRGGTVSWRGELPPSEHGEFVLDVRLPKSPQRLTFPAVQTCGQAVVRWDEPPAADGARGAHAAPVLEVANTPHAAPAPADTLLPPGVERHDGYLTDAAGRPLYTFAGDTMVGMSHCVGPCAQAWPPLPAPADAKPIGAWTPIWRDDGAVQWTYRDKPLYTYAKDARGAAPAGEAHAEWRLAR